MSRDSNLPAACRTALEDHLQADFFQALCDPVRLALVAHLAASGRPLTVTDASECCGIHFSGVSRHLAILKRAGIVQADKQGREVHYRLEMSALVSTLRGVADALEACAGQGERASA